MNKINDNRNIEKTIITIGCKNDNEDIGLYKLAHFLLKEEYHLG
jgi:hypothetical protein